MDYTHQVLAHTDKWRMTAVLPCEMTLQFKKVLGIRRKSRYCGLANEATSHEAINAIQTLAIPIEGLNY